MVLLVTVSLTGCASKEETKSGYTAGTFTTTTPGHNGDITIEVTFDVDSITDIKITDHKETYGIGYGVATAPIDSLPAEIIKTQSLGVDSVAGATITSNALKRAVADCVDQAGGDSSVLKNVVVANNNKDEEYTADIVVVGAGAAGLAAAVTAKEAGANVIIMEKVGIPGGSTTRSGGKILAAGTDVQKNQGFDDNADLMFQYLMSFDHDGLMNETLVKKFCDNSLENFNWLVERGTIIQDVEAIHSSITPWRVHNALGGGGMTVGFGGQYIVPLDNEFETSGGKVIYNCEAKELLTENGTVVGVMGERKDGTTVTVNAKSVIICTGGYEHNEEMMARYASFLPDNSASACPKTNVGDGLVMAEKVGAQIFDSEGLQVSYRDGKTGVGLFEESGLIVTDKGVRVSNEYSYKEHVATGLAEAPSPYGYYIATSNDPNKTVQYAMTVDSTYKASTLDELAEITGMDAETIKTTVARYNELCSKGVDEDFGKPAEYMIPIEGDTYYAIKLEPGSCVNFGGLVINENAEVLDTNNQVIPGLYAAGEVAFTGLFATEYPCCGMAIGSAIFYGRTAAQTALSK